MRQCFRESQTYTIIKFKAYCRLARTIKPGNENVSSMGSRRIEKDLRSSDKRPSISFMCFRSALSMEKDWEQNTICK